MDVPDRLRALVGQVGGNFFVEVGSRSDVKADDLAFLAQSGIDSLRIRSADVFDLRWLGPSIAEFRKLTLASHLPLPKGTKTDNFYVGLRALESAAALERLEVGVDLAEPIDLSGLPNLRVVHCDGYFALSAARNPSVRDLHIDVSRLPDSFSISAPLSKLVVYAGSRLSDLRMLEESDGLTDLAVGDSQRFDVAALARMRALRRVTFHGVRELRHAEVLLDLPHLERLDVSGAREIENSGSLIGLRARWFNVESNFVFDDDFQLLAAGKSDWTFTKYRGGAAKPNRSTSPADSVFDRMGPFDLRVLEPGTFALVFDDWDGLAHLLERSVGDVGGDTADEVISQLLTELRPDVELETSVDGGVVSIESHDMELLTLVGTLLGGAWHDEQHIRSIAKQLGV
jgi:hypothetical protein